MSHRIAIALASLGAACIVALVGFVLFIFLDAAPGRAFKNVSPAMEPTLLVGDYFTIHFLPAAPEKRIRRGRCDDATRHNPMKHTEVVDWRVWKAAEVAKDAGPLYPGGSPIRAGDHVYTVTTLEGSVLGDVSFITPSPVRGGKPCIRGLRITVYDILDYLAGGMTEDQILSDFPDLEREEIRAALAFAGDRERRLISGGAA